MPEREICWCVCGKRPVPMQRVGLPRQLRVCPLKDRALVAQDLSLMDRALVAQGLSPQDRALVALGLTLLGR